MKGTNFSGMSTSNSFRSMNATSAVAGSGFRVCNGKYERDIKDAQERIKKEINGITDAISARENQIKDSKKRLEYLKQAQKTMEQAAKADADNDDIIARDLVYEFNDSRYKFFKNGDNPIFSTYGMSV